MLEIELFDHLTVWFGSFVLWYINICRLFNAKAILREEQ